MVYLLFGTGILILSIVFRLAAVFRLTIPLLYALLAPLLFRDWYLAHTVLSEAIFFALLALVVLSWAVSLARKVRYLIDQRREERFSEQIYLRRYRQAVANGEDIAGIPIDDLWRD